MGPISIFKAKKEKGRATDRGGKESRENFPPPPPPLFPATTSQQRKKKFQLAGGALAPGLEGMPGLDGRLLFCFWIQNRGRGRQRVVCLEGREFYPSFFSSPFLFLARPLPKAPSPLLLSSKAGRRVSGGRKEPRRRSSTPPSHFPPPRRPKNPYPFVFFPGRRAAPSLPNHPTTASSSSIPSSLSLSGEAFAVADFPSRWGEGEIKFSAHLERRRKGQKEMGNKEEKEIEFALKVARDIHLVGANKHSSSPNPNPSSALLS